MHAIVKSIAIVTFAGFACAATAAPPEISSGATVTISKNKATNVISGGAKGAGITEGGIGKFDAKGETNVNSLVVREGKVKGTVTISENEAKDIKNFGGALNVNSVVLGK
jgi:hypothetical protein